MTRSVVKFGQVFHAAVHHHRWEFPLHIYYRLLLFLLLIHLVMHLLVLPHILSRGLVLRLILAWLALAVFRAPHTCVVALAVAFETVRFFAVTSFFWEGAVASAAFLDGYFGTHDDFLEAGRIFAVVANTILATLFPLGETFAVHFETEGLFASTSDFAFFSGLGCSVDVGDAVDKRILGVEVGGGNQLDVLEGGMVGDDVDGVDEFECVVDFWQFFEGGEIEARKFGVFVHIL